MPEIWLSYGDSEVSLKLKREDLDDVLSLNPPESSISEVNAKYYVTDGIDRSEQIAREVFRDLAPLRPGEQLAEEIVDGYLVKRPLGLAETVLICAVRSDPVYWFTGPHSLTAKLMAAEEEVIKRKEGFGSCSEDGAVWFSRRLLETSGVKAYCYFGRSGRAISGPGTEVYEKLRSYFSSFSIKHRHKSFVIASAGGTPYDDNLKEALLSVYGLRGILKEGSELIIVAKCGGGLGDEGLRRAILGERSESYAVKVLRELQQRATVSIVSSLPLTYVEGLGMKGYSSLTEAFEGARKAGKAFIVENSYLFCRSG